MSNRAHHHSLLSSKGMLRLLIRLGGAVMPEASSGPDRFVRPSDEAVQQPRIFRMLSGA